MRNLPTRHVRFIAFAMLVAPALTGGLAAQQPGAPVLQNAFNNPGVTVAGNYASGDKTTLYGLAAAYAPGAGRFQFSGGLGKLTLDQTSGSGTSWGVRLAVPLFSFASGRAGIAPFVGYGSASADSVTLTQLPVGVGAGWRMALGATRGLSVYATGTYLSAKTKVGDASQSNGRVRFSVAGDVTLVRNLGLTLGYEAGSNAADNEAGPTGGIFGAGLSWAFR